MATVLLRIGTDDAANMGTKSGVFRWMFQVAATRIKHYQGDMFHDALWLDANLKMDVPFYWGMRDAGTSIGFDEALVSYGNDEVWRLTLTRNRLWTVVVIEGPETDVKL